ncbi:MAG TPA: hypothetical protein VGS23_08770 [Thermoplasmata archaeon]|nr:hypothetical protein [Thermoplasmata archaeon]
MSATTRGLGCGVVLGLALVLLGQQLGLFGLSDLVPALEYLVVGALVLGVVGALVGWRLGRRYAAP